MKSSKNKVYFLEQCISTGTKCVTGQEYWDTGSHTAHPEVALRPRISNKHARYAGTAEPEAHLEYQSLNHKHSLR